MGIDLSRFKVVHGDKVFNAIALMEVHMPENVEWDKRDGPSIATITRGT